MSRKAKMALIIAIFFWASAFVGIRESLKTFSPEGLALFRYLIASFCMGIIYFCSPKSAHFGFLEKCSLMMVGIVGIGIYNITLNYGELEISSCMSSFITSQSPMLTALFAICFLGESVSFLCVIGFLITLLGVVCLSLGEFGGFKWGESLLYILLATFSASCYSVLQKPFLDKFHVIETTTYIIWGGTLFLSIYTPQLKQDLITASYKSTLTVIYLGIFPAALAYLAWSYALTKMQVSQAVVFLYGMPFVATFLGWVWLGEMPEWQSILGGVFAMIGIWLVNHASCR